MRRRCSRWGSGRRGGGGNNRRQGNRRWTPMHADSRLRRNGNGARRRRGEKARRRRARTAAPAGRVALTPCPSPGLERGEAGGEEAKSPVRCAQGKLFVAFGDTDWWVRSKLLTNAEGRPCGANAGCGLHTTQTANPRHRAVRCAAWVRRERQESPGGPFGLAQGRPGSHRAGGKSPEATEAPAQPTQTGGSGASS